MLATQCAYLKFQEQQTSEGIMGFLCSGYDEGSSLKIVHDGTLHSKTWSVPLARVSIVPECGSAQAQRAAAVIVLLNARCESRALGAVVLGLSD